jgi:steroid delta-isomerase-like uncharacterized protein
MPTSPKELVERVVEEIYNHGNLDLIDELYSPDIVREVLPMAPIVGREALRQYVQEIRKAYPDFHIEVEQILVDGDRTATSFVVTGTHEGQSPSVPVPPTGKKIRLRGTVIGLTENGQGVREVVYQDTLGLMQQLGVIPGPPRT